MADARARIAALAQRSGLRFELARSVTERLHSIRIERPLAGSEMKARLAKLAADPKVVFPPKNKVRESIEALIHHFHIASEGFPVPPGEVYASIESPKGELGFYLVSALF